MAKMYAKMTVVYCFSATGAVALLVSFYKTEIAMTYTTDETMISLLEGAFDSMKFALIITGCALACQGILKALK